MTVLVSDSFNRADSATSLGTTDSYNGGTAKTWTMYGPSANLPTYGISSNQAYMVSNNGGFTNNSFAGINVGVSDVTYTVTMNLAAACYLVLRASDNNHYVRLASGNPYVLQSYNNGTFTTIASASVGSATGDVISVTLNGSSITVSKNGTQIISTTSTFNQTSTIFGFSGQNNTSTKFDNFEIDDVNIGGTNATVNVTIANATASSLAPTVTAQQNISVSSVAASSTANAVNPTVSASKNITVTSVIGSAQATTQAPQVGSFTNVSVNTATANATASANNPSVAITRGININASLSNAAASAMAPNVGPLSVQINVLTGSLIANAIAPIVSMKNIVIGVIQLHGGSSSAIQLKGSNGATIQLKGGIT